MSETQFSIALLWLFIFIYSIAGSLDFGTGFWSMVYSNRKDTKAGDIANKYLSPAWEITNVLLVMFVVALVSFFPNATFTLGTALMVPANLILVLLSIRTAFMVFAYSAKEYKTILNRVSGVTGILVPALLVVVLPITHGGFIQDVNGVLQLPLSKVFTSPTVYAFIGMAISMTLYLSALLLADYASITGDRSALDIYRKHSMWIGPFTILLGFLIILAIKNEANWLYVNLRNYLLWIILSVLSFFVGYWSLWRTQNDTNEESRGPRIALISVIVQLFFASYAYGKAHLPYLVYPTTIQESITNSAMYRALVVSYIVGTFLMLPAFIWHWRLFIRNREYVK
ncbi:cytochrome d ubiquinol oxidase subunit II [Tepidibacillus fermentans]|uniref:Cytochrome bd-I ubiquinol oxidase subunit 2 apoprotein n=1 Tax=Tepidibacillus fermentans TaxID=1281767 RepID=A0A4R3KDB3_9BACI|nr:cytochrome d ubiquinol oxidase subunit II [Tepidibacillus fermentans]TCS81075.1 cytochrome bd-I ubiquinol oxidase subunit 2 apoprotein [Tepidibacillus fermentans]